MAKRINKNFIKVNLDCTPYLEEVKKTYNLNPNSELAINYYFRAFNPVIFFNGTNAYYPDTKNPENIGKEVPENLLTVAIKDDLNKAWARK